jgi:hypothetical protein
MKEPKNALKSHNFMYQLGKNLLRRFRVFSRHFEAEVKKITMVADVLGLTDKGIDFWLNLKKLNHFYVVKKL